MHTKPRGPLQVWIIDTEGDETRVRFETKTADGNAKSFSLQWWAGNVAIVKRITGLSLTMKKGRDGVDYETISLEGGARRARRSRLRQPG